MMKIDLLKGWSEADKNISIEYYNGVHLGQKNG